MSEKIIGVKRVLKRGRIIRKVGLDTTILVALLDDKQEYSDYEPSLFRNKNVVFVSQFVFDETKKILIKKGETEENAVNKILNYLYNKNITIIKPGDLDKNKVNSILIDLFSERKKIEINPPEPPDLKIMAIYKSKNIDCISTLNKIHFEYLCNYLGIEIEVPRSDLSKMMRNIFGWKKRH